MAGLAPARGDGRPGPGVRRVLLVVARVRTIAIAVAFGSRASAYLPIVMALAFALSRPIEPTLDR